MKRHERATTGVLACMLAIALAGCAGGASEPGDVLLDGDVIDTTEPSSPVETGDILDR